MGRLEILHLLSVALAYYVSAKLGLMLAIEPGYATGFWPAAGIALAATLAFGWRVLPGVWLGSFLANALPPSNQAQAEPFIRIFLIPSIIGCGATAQAAAGAYLVRRLREPNAMLESVWNVVLLMLGGPLSCLVNATLAVGALFAVGIITPGAVWNHWWTWWLGDAAGVVLVAPLILAWSAKPARNYGWVDALWAGSILILLFLVGQIVFREWSPLVPSHYPITFLPLPLAIWAAYQFGTYGATAASLVLALIATAATIAHLGPFGGWKPNESLLLVQVYIGIVSGMTLILSAAVAERDRANERMKRSKAQMGGILKTSLDSIITINGDGIVVELNPATEKIFGYSRAEMLGHSLAELIIPKDMRENHSQGLARAIATGNSAMLDKVIEMKATRANGREFPVELVISRLDLPDGPLFTGHIRDITQRKLSEKQLRHYATHDALTGAANRVLLLERLRGAITSRAWKKEYQFAVMYVDVDGFKAVNDEYGHEVGDLLLVTVADRIRHCLRENDLLSRIGGDEFVILLDGLVDESEAKAIAERIKIQMSEPYQIESHQLKLTVSYGLAACSRGSVTPEDLIREADLRMYATRKEGRVSV